MTAGFLTDGSGLRSGTSFNSLGINGDCELSKLSGSEALEKLTLVNSYVHQIVREYKGERITYKVFSLE